MNLRNLANGQQCQLRFPGCRGRSETVVLCHVRRGGVAGIGQKPPDLCGVYGCAACHDVMDGRVMLPNLSRVEIDQQVLLALCRTLAIVSKELDV